MTWTADNTGTTTLTVGTPNTLVSGDTTNGTYVFKANLNNLAAGDIISIIINSKDLSTGSLYQTYKKTYGPAPLANPLTRTDPIPSDLSVQIIASQTAGTGRSVTWELLRI